MPPLWALCAGEPVPGLAWAQPGKRGLFQIPGGDSLSSAGLSWACPGVGQPGQAPPASGTCCAQSLLTRWVSGLCKTKLDVLLLITLQVTWLHLVTESEVRILSHVKIPAAFSVCQSVALPTWVFSCVFLCFY